MHSIQCTLHFSPPTQYPCLRRGSAVLIVQGDQQGRRKMDAKLVGQAIDAAVEVSLPVVFSNATASSHRCSVSRYCKMEALLVVKDVRLTMCRRMLHALC